MAVPGNYYANLVQGKETATIPTFILESGFTLKDVSVTYSTWGTLNQAGDNVLVVCHALTGSSDAFDWWRPLMGHGKALDSSRYFIFCANVLGSPYGSASPLSINPVAGTHYGPTFPDTTIRDDVRIHKLVLDRLGVQGVAVVIGGSMGGMHTLEWPLCTSPGYVKNIIPIATSAYQGAWSISWGKTQTQAIYADATFHAGWYDPVPEGQPRSGLGLARMVGMLTYRSFDSFEARFGRRTAAPAKQKLPVETLPTPPLSDNGSTTSITEDPQDANLPSPYSVQSYLQYQADKFLDRFDANCYLHLTKKMNTHDVTRDRIPDQSSNLTPTIEGLMKTLNLAPEGALVVGVESDLLFPLQQQATIAQCLPGSTLATLKSRDGHDGFLLEFERLNEIIRKHLEAKFPQLYQGPGSMPVTDIDTPVTNSVFGEIENVEY